jgi:16S rRNA (cytosine967-C5)-methyltransferase
MQNKGKVISLDVEEWKLDELRKRSRRAGAFNVQAIAIVGGKTIESLSGKGDKVLLDVPCSGSGVLKRNPDAKWKLNAEVFEKTRRLQQDILARYAGMAKVKGHIVYSTCSIFPSENRKQVDIFLNSNVNFEFVTEKTLLPGSGTDGFYMAMLKRVK